MSAIMNPQLAQAQQRGQGEEVITTGFKWLRAVGIEEFTGVHMDRVFLGGSSRMLTVWIPISKCPTWCGPIMVRPPAVQQPSLLQTLCACNTANASAPDHVQGAPLNCSSAEAVVGFTGRWRAARTRTQPMLRSSAPTGSPRWALMGPPVGGCMTMAQLWPGTWAGRWNGSRPTSGRGTSSFWTHACCT